jgi:hypothetical protein
MQNRVEFLAPIIEADWRRVDFCRLLEQEFS